MSDKEIDRKIGEAWKAHYKGEHARAIDLFSQLAQQVPDHVDAQWGLGLAYRAAGDLENGAEAFKRAKALIESDLAKNPQEYGRLFLLNRMINQQLDYISDFIK